ncbi:MAG: MFS transporter [bacterium]
MTKRSIPIKQYLLFDMNSVVRLLVISDVIWMGALGLLGPIFSLFVVEFIEGADASVAGTAAAIYLITKSILQIPAASLIDRIRGEKDDFWIMFLGSIAAALIPLLYLVIRTPGQLYLVQFLYGGIVAFTFPSYMALFTRHIDRGREGTDWGIYFTLTDLSGAAAASIGGVLATKVGYHPLIVVLAGISLLGTLVLFPIRSFIFKK